jgi:hypothetical protein
MNLRQPIARLPLVATLSVGLLGCMGENPSAPGVATGPAPLPPALQSNNVLITNDPDVLEARIERTYEPLTVTPKSPTREELSGALKSGDIGVQLTLVGTVRPPEVDGIIVQANDVDIDGNRAVVSYNTAGDVFAGAVQVIDFSKPDRPRVISEVLYRDADVNAVALLGNHLYAGMASDDPALTSPALLEELDLTGANLSQTGVWVDLPSWACTDLAVHGDGVVASVGALGGGVAFLRRGAGLELAGFAPQFDVRSVAMDVDAAMGVGGGEGILERRVLPAMTLEARVSVDGYRNDAAKGTIEVYSHRCYLGAGDGGIQVRGGDGGLLDGLSCGDLTSSGSLAVVNAVSCANHLAFVAAGPQGIQVVRLGRYRCDGRESEESEGLRLLGQLALEDGASCNMVKAKNDLLIVAAGAGGVKLVSMRFDD